MKDDDITKLFQQRVRDTEARLREWRKEARENYEFVAGHQISDEDRAALEEQLRPAIIFNRIDPVVSSVSGHQINNQHMVKYLPRTQGDAKPNELYTEAARWIDDESDAQDEISDAFWDLIVTGMGFTETRMDYNEDAEGKCYGAERVPPLEMGWDTMAKKRNLADARFVYRANWWNRKDATMKWPKIKDIDTESSEVWSDELFGEDDHDATEAWKYENDASRWYDKDKDQILIFQYQYWELRPVYMVADEATGKLREFSEAKFNKIKEQLKLQGTRYIRQLRKHYRQAFLVGDNLLEDKEAPCPHSFTLRAITGRRDETKRVWYGLVRAMKDPQQWSNKFFSEIENILTSNRTGGAFVEEWALANPRQAEEEWNDANPLIFLNEGAIAKGAIMERQPINYPQGLDRLMQVAIGSIPQVTGINPEMMGLVDRDQPGVLEAQRKRAGMTILATLFNSLRRYNKERGRVLLYFIEEYVADGRLIRITSDQGGEQYVPLVRQMTEENSKYDVVVSDSPTSPNQKEETYAILTQIIPHVLKMGIPIPPEVLDFMPLPADLISKWKEMLANQRQNPQQQKMAEAQLQEILAKVEKDRSSAQLNEVKAAVEQMNATTKNMEAKVKQFDALMKHMEERREEKEPTSRDGNQRG